MNIKNNPLSPLKFRIIGASTEEPESPIYSLLQPPEKSQGWSSIRFCSYPQEILLQFTEPVRLCQINLLLHHNKIPNKIDIYHFFPKTYTDLFEDYNTLTYDKLGYVIPDTNAKTEYNARELKKVFINDNCLYLKLVFHKNYSNIHNYFNQVGLIHIECFGYYFTKHNISSLFPNKERISNDPELFVPSDKIDDIQMDEMCQIKILELQEKLKVSIDEEDYDYSKLLNGDIARIRLLGGKMLNLEQIKLKAIEINDYDTAKVMKIEINRIKAIIKDIEVKDNIVPNYENEDNMMINDTEEPVDDRQSNSEINNKYEDVDRDKYKSKSRLIQEQKKQKELIAQQSQINSTKNFEKSKDDGRKNFQEDDDGVLEYAEEA